MIHMGDSYGHYMTITIKAGLCFILCSLCYLSILWQLQASDTAFKINGVIRNVGYLHLQVHIPFRASSIFHASNLNEVQNGAWHIAYGPLYQKARREGLAALYVNHRHKKLSLPWPFHKAPSPPSPSSSPSPSTLPSSPATPSPSSPRSVSSLAPSTPLTSPPGLAPFSPQIVPDPSTFKPVVVAVVVTAVATSLVLFLVFFFHQKFRRSKKKVRENPYSNPYGSNPLLETSLRSDLWKDHVASGMTWKKSSIRDDASTHSVRSYNNGSIDGGSEETMLKVNGNRELDELGSPEWMGRSGFRAFSRPADTTQAQTGMALRPSPSPSSPSFPQTSASAIPSQNAAWLHRLPVPPSREEAKLEHTGSDSSFDGFWPYTASGRLVASSLAKGPRSTDHAHSSAPQSSGMLMQDVTRLHEVPEVETDLYPYKPYVEEMDLYPYKPYVEEMDLYPYKPHAGATVFSSPNPFMTPERREVSHSHSSYAAAIFGPVDGAPKPSTPASHTNDDFSTQMPGSNKSANAASRSAFSFSTQVVHPLPLPPALVSASIVKGQQKGDVSAGEIALSTPIKSVAAALSSELSEPHLAPVSSSRLSYRPMLGVSSASVSLVDAMNPSFAQAPSSSATVPPAPTTSPPLSTSTKASTAPPRAPPPPGGSTPPRPPAPSPPSAAKGPPPPPPKLPGANTPPCPPAPPPPSAPKAPPPPPPKLPGANTPPRPPAPPPPTAPKGPPPPPLISHASRPPLPSKPVQGPSGEGLLKLKPLHWDKVLADPSRSMVWDKLKAGSFHLDENGIATRFGLNTSTNVKKDGKSSMPAVNKGPIDSKKAQNIAIQLRALNISTQDICNALLEGEGLKSELLEVLVKMSPTQEEQKALLGFGGDRSELGPAESFLISILEIPSAFQRIEAMQFKAGFKEDISQIKESLQILEVACNQIRESRLFLKLLEAVLKTGNHMNRGTTRGEAEAFKLDTLLKLADVKSADGKTTLLHYVVEEIIKAEGLRVVQASKGADSAFGLDVEIKGDDIKRKGMEVVVKLFTELENVKRAAGIDADALNQAVSKIANRLSATQTRLKTSFQVQASSNKFLPFKDSFHANMELFCSQATEDVSRIKQDAARVFDKVKQATAYFHGNQRETQPLQLLVIVRDFLFVLDKVCKDIAKPLKMNIRGGGGG